MITKILWLLFAVSGIQLFFSNNIFSQQGWVMQNIGLRKYVAVNFINEMTGYVAGEDKVILKTTNLGLSWTLFNPYIKSPNPARNAFFLSDSIQSLLLINEIYISTNAGFTWNYNSIQPIGIGIVSLKSIYILNSTTAYVCGNDFGMTRHDFYVDGIIYKTTNSGVNWFQSYRGSVDFYDIKFNDELTGYCTWSSVERTTDGGIFWDYFGEVNAVTFSITHSFNDTMYMSGDSGKIYRSLNGGANWTKHYTPSHDTLRELHFVNARTGYAVGDSGVIIKTSNAGLNWTMQNSNTIKNLKSVWFINKDTGFAVGDSGVVLRTYTGGVLVNVNNTMEFTPSELILYQNYPNPFNPNTVIRYSLVDNCFVILKIYNVFGKEVATLIHKTQGAGSYSVEFDGANFSSGIYYYKMHAGTYIEVKKMILLK